MEYRFPKHEVNCRSAYIGNQMLTTEYAVQSNYETTYVFHRHTTQCVTFWYLACQWMPA
jgi:hypothetical protein